MRDILPELDACHTTRAVAQWLLARAGAVTAAPMGNVQIMDWRSGALAIHAQTGFQDEFLNYFRHVRLDGRSVCAQALRRRDAVTVDDVLIDAGPNSAVFAHASVRAVQSFPLISDGDALVGMVSTHFHAPQRLSPAQLSDMAGLAGMAANRLVMLAADKPLRTTFLDSKLRITESADALARADALLARGRAWSGG